MARSTSTSKSAQARAQREAKAAEQQSGAALPGGTTVKRDGEDVPADEQAAEAQSLVDAEANETAAVKRSTEVKEVTEIPKTKSSGSRRADGSIWTERLVNVTKTASGKALIYSCAKSVTANSRAYALRQMLKEKGKDGKPGAVNVELKEKGIDPNAFTIAVHGMDIYAEFRPAA